MPFDVFRFGETIIDKLFPDKDEANRQKVKLLELEQNGELAPLTLRYSAITTEAASGDKWTSRARPSFMYVMYTMILSAIPTGWLYAFFPDVTERAIAGMGLWFAAIPGDLYVLFGAGYLGYAATRTIDKKGLVDKLGFGKGGVH